MVPLGPLEVRKAAEKKEKRVREALEANLSSS
jgi:hypothetical protein